MGLNKSKGNMYPFITDTWNPLGGECPHGCSYCSTNKFHYPVLLEKYSGKPRLFEKELTTNLGKGKFIFVCAQNDLFAKEIPKEFILKVINHCQKFDNKYLFQTKNPARVLEFVYADVLPLQSVICTTIETNRELTGISISAPHPIARAMNIGRISLTVDTHVTIEPIIDFDHEEFVRLIKMCGAVQVNIGADSGNNNLPEPSKEKVLQLIEALGKFTTVYQKKNLKRITG